MRRFISIPGIIVLVGLNIAVAQEGMEDVQIKATHVAGKIYMLEGRGGNIGVSAGTDGVLIVDDQFAPLADKIRAALRKINPGKLEFVLNTHYHGDHIGGNVEFGPEAHIIAHTNVRKRLSTPQQLFGRTLEPQPAEALPVITFDKSLSLHFNGEEIRVIHFPHGHTDGDSIIFFTQSNVVHMGDHMFNGMFPFVDLDHGGDVKGMADNVQAVIEQVPGDVKVIPGHGPLADRDDLKTFHAMLVGTTSHVQTQRAAGKSLVEIKAAGVPAKWESWGNGFIKTDRWLETIYNSLDR